jgi:1-acyl-sn-glycerol-3-phosphate acyltransferase
MSIIRAILRLTVTFIVIFFSIPVVAISTIIPGRHRGAPAAAWVVTWLCRAFLFIYGIKLHVPEKKRLIEHQGFVFPNHDSYIDVAIPLSITPVRFISRIENRKMPFIGWLAKSIDTVFVDRQDKSSREAAREALSGTELYPPMMLYPEGRIDRDPGIAEFRHGAFEIAVDNEIPFMPAVIVYEEFEIAAWLGESLFDAVWRLARHRRTHCHLLFLPTITPSAENDPIALAEATRTAMLTALNDQRSKS